MKTSLRFFMYLMIGSPHFQKEVSDAWLIPRISIHSIVKMMQKEGYIQCGTEDVYKRQGTVSPRRSCGSVCECCTRE